MSATAIPRSRLVYGSIGSGHRRNAKRIAKHFGLTKVATNWTPGDAVPTHDTLVIANERPEGFGDPEYANRVHAYTDVARDLGLDNHL